MSTKTKDRILAKYYWSGVFQEVVQYCRSCEVCQRCGTMFSKAGMIPMPFVAQPFQRIAMHGPGRSCAKDPEGKSFYSCVV